MFKHTVVARWLVAGLAIGAASFPAGAQAMFELSPGGSDATVVSRAALQQPGPSTQSGFEWGDAGVGAVGALVLIGGGAGTMGAVRRRRLHRAITG